mgnify:CR=1 FL=1|jgi:hypothetical protein
MKTDINPLSHVKFTKIYTDGRQEDFKFNDPVYKVLFTAAFLNRRLMGKTLERYDELLRGEHDGADWLTTKRAYIPFMDTEDFCLYFVRLENRCNDKLVAIFHETTFVLKVEWVR